MYAYEYRGTRMDLGVYAYHLPYFILLRSTLSGRKLP